jgi:transcriptional regulator with XRE-family HTH domain
MTSPGGLLREWRLARRLSQLDLALEADISTRHLSCLETGKAQPSRDMIDRLAQALGVPLRERNAILIAAGYAPVYSETSLTDTGLTAVRQAVQLILDHQEPFPAFVINRHWEILQANKAAAAVGSVLIGSSIHTNMLRQFCDPQDFRRVVVNWEEVAGDLIRHLHESIAAVPSDQIAQALLADVLRYPGIPSRWSSRGLDTLPPPVLTVHFRKEDLNLRFFSTITTFATSRDITVEELRIECAFPADPTTEQFCRRLAGNP